MCLVGHLAVSLTSTHQVPTVPQVMTTKLSPDIAKCPVRGKIAKVLTNALTDKDFQNTVTTIPSSHPTKLIVTPQHYLTPYLCLISPVVPKMSLYN